MNNELFENDEPSATPTQPSLTLPSTPPPPYIYNIRFTTLETTEYQLSSVFSYLFMNLHSSKL